MKLGPTARRGDEGGRSSGHPKAVKTYAFLKDTRRLCQWREGSGEAMNIGKLPELGHYVQRILLYVIGIQSSESCY